MGGVDLLPELAHVTCAVLVVAGDLDPVCGVDAAAEIVAALPTGLVRFCQFPVAGHHIHRDQPDRFPLLREFVAGQVAPSIPVPAMAATAGWAGALQCPPCQRAGVSVVRAGLRAAGPMARSGEDLCPGCRGRLPLPARSSPV